MAAPRPGHRRGRRCPRPGDPRQHRGRLATRPPPGPSSAAAAAAAAAGSSAAAVSLPSRPPPRFRLPSSRATRALLLPPASSPPPSPLPPGPSQALGSAPSDRSADSDPGIPHSSSPCHAAQSSATPGPPLASAYGTPRPGSSPCPRPGSAATWAYAAARRHDAPSSPPLVRRPPRPPTG